MGMECVRSFFSIIAANKYRSAWKVRGEGDAQKRLGWNVVSFCTDKIVLYFGVMLAETMSYYGWFRSSLEQSMV